jgi:kinesin family protein C2/C3
LAGSERIAKSGSEGDRMKEALNINLSLTTLGKVLTALANHDSHIPYRDSKLTHMLKESLGGDAKTLVIVQVSPNPRDTNESNSTLGFGVRVAQVEKGATKPNVIKKKRSSSIAIN